MVSSPSIAGLQIPQIKFGTWLEILEPVDTKQETDHETVLVRVWKNRVYSGGFGLPEDEFCLRVAQRPLKRGMIERNRRELEESDAIKAPLGTAFKTFYFYLSIDDLIRPPVHAHLSHGAIRHEFGRPFLPRARQPV